MKKMFLSVFCMLLSVLVPLLSPCSAEDAETMLLEEEGLTVAVHSASAEADRIRLDLSCAALSAGEEEPLQFLVPAVNGADTVFESGWPGEEWTLSPGQPARGELQVLLPEDAAAPYTLTLRFAFGGLLSTPASLPVPETADAVPASFGGTEQQVISPEIAWEAAGDPEGFRVEDGIPAEAVPRVEVSLAWFCLRTEEGLFVPFSCAPLTAGPDGRYSAVSRGTALFFTDADESPLCFRETERDGILRFEPDALTLVGETVYFATLDFAVVPDGQGYALTGQTLHATELGGDYPAAPLVLFEAAEPLYTEFAWTGDELVTERTRVPSLPLDRPLGLRLVPAASLGEVWGICEYDLSDGSRIYHEPVLLKGR